MIWLPFNSPLPRAVLFSPPCREAAVLISPLRTPTKKVSPHHPPCSLSSTPPTPGTPSSSSLPFIPPLNDLFSRKSCRLRLERFLVYPMLEVRTSLPTCPPFANPSFPPASWSNCLFPNGNLTVQTASPILARRVLLPFVAHGTSSLGLWRYMRRTGRLFVPESDPVLSFLIIILARP